MQNFIFEIKIKKPFDFKRTVQKPAGWHWATPFEIFENDILYSALRLSNNRLVGLKLSENDTVVKIEAYNHDLNTGEKEELLELIKLGLGAEEDLAGFYRQAKNDDLVAQLKKDLYGMRLGFPTGVFERAILAITLQMAPTKRSNQMMDCLIKQYGDTVKVDDKEIFYWPSPKVISKVQIAKLAKDCKLGYRAKYVNKVAQQIESDFPSILELKKLSEEEAQKKVENLPGIGSYSAQIISPYFGFPLDVWSARIFHEILCDETPSHPREEIKKLEAKASERWGKYKQYVFVYVLHDLQRLKKQYSISKLA